MTYYISRDEYSASSEEYFPDQRSDSLLFSQPAEVDDWCQSVPFSSGFPLTPPDTASDCDPSDFPDMTSQPWTVPEDEWTHDFAVDNAAWVQASECDWQSQKSPMANPDSQAALESSAWLRTTYGSVDTGLSPALSHESQTSRTPSSYANQDIPLLPRNLDFSFVGTMDPSWDVSVPAPSRELTTIHSDAYAATLDPNAFVSVDGLPGYPLYHANAGVSVPVGSPQLSAYPAQGLDHHSRRRTTSDASSVYQRPILPRTNLRQSNPDVHASARQCRTLKPRKTSVGFTDTVNSVSDASGPSQVPARAGHGYVHVSGPHTPIVQAVGSSSSRSEVTTPLEAQYQGRMLAPVPNSQDTTTLDIDSFIKYDQDDQPSGKAVSYSQGLVSAPTVNPRRPSVITNPIMTTPSNEASTWSPAANLPVNAPAGPSNDVDEGRHRNHPLYGKGPSADGLYHCPWENDQSCQHKPAKLKCAYDKFVDSHLKPFRCKHSACAKQEFSSTACLLRHEREAHGMHGHGDRPHLCHYTGCDRSQPGNGFPRKYNLYDHMKRVHDHKETIQENPTYPDGDGRGMRKGGGRKRKSQGTGVGEPAAQRQRQLSQGYNGQTFAPEQWSTS